MAGVGLLALLDDITTILDDVAVLSKVAAQKTAGIAGDDLAVSSQAVVGIDPSRELPIVGKVALGSALNKCVLVPIALALPTVAITPLLACGGLFLCYEGFHKVAHRHDEQDEKHEKELITAIHTGPEALANVEWSKVKQAIGTDVVLSAEIVAVALGSVAEQPFATKALVLALVSAVMTVGIYGLVALIVKLDDIGLYLQRSPPGSARHRAGGVIVTAAPKLMKVISVVGTAAMFLVGGGIVLHAFHGAEEAVHHAIEGVVGAAAGGWVMAVVPVVVGVLLGAVVSGVVAAVGAVGRRLRPAA